jgi:restriction system protein
MLPLLRATASGEELRTRDLIDVLARHFQLTDEDRQKMLPSGTQRVFDNRVYWSASYLRKAGLLEATRRGYVRISAVGQDVLRKNPSRIDISFLSQFPSFVQFKAGAPPGPSTFPSGLQSLETQSATPEERMEVAWQELRRQQGAELLERIKNSSAEFFERLVVDLIVKMGYGGSIKDAGQALGRSGDGGLDGIVKQDRLGLDAIYLQAKKWENTVGRPVIQAFAGSLEGAKARKGVLITTSTFSADAREYVNHIEKKIVLIDGDSLIELMLDHGVGVSIAKSYVTHKLDLDYFDDTL